MGRGKRTGKVKVQEFMSWDKDSSLGLAKLHAQAKQNTEFTTSPQPFPGKQKLECNLSWEDTCHHFDIHHLLLYTSFSDDHDTVWVTPLVSLDQLSCLHPLSAACAPPASLLGGQHNKQKSIWICASTAWQQLNIGVLSPLPSLQIQNTALYEPLWRTLTLPANTRTNFYKHP